MNIPIQLENVSIARAANAAHYEYLQTVVKRVEEVRLENELWQRAVDEMRRAFAKEDKAFKQYRASLKTSPLKEADTERDRQYASLRDAVKAFAKFPIAEMADAAAPLLRIIKNYKIDTSANYMKESGNIDNLLQDMSAYGEQLRRLQLNGVVDQLRTSNDRVRQLLAERNVERSDVVLGELATARRASDEAYAALVLYTNAYTLLNPDRREAQDLVKRMSEDLDYFRKHAMTDPHRTRKSGDSGEEVPQEGAEPTAEPEASV